MFVIFLNTSMMLQRRSNISPFSPVGVPYGSVCWFESPRNFVPGVATSVALNSKLSFKYENADNAGLDLVALNKLSIRND